MNKFVAKSIQGTAYLDGEDDKIMRIKMKMKVKKRRKTSLVCLIFLFLPLERGVLWVGNMSQRKALSTGENE